MKINWTKVEDKILSVLLSTGGIIITLAVFLVLAIAFLRIN